MNVDKCHKALLKLAEEFRTKQPPDLKSCMQCLHAILNLPVSPYVIARTNYHLGYLIHKYTYDTNIAQTYLEKAYELAQTPDLTYIRLQVVALLVDIYLNQNQRPLAKQLLSRAINETTTSGGGNYNLYWHYRFLLKLSHLNLEDGEFANANNQLSIGAQTAGATEDSFTQVLFLLSKSMVLLIARKYPNSVVQQPQQLTPEQHLAETMALAGNLLDAWQGDQSRKEGLKIFFLVLQVCHHLNKGHNKSAKPSLKLLQQSIQNITNVVGPDTLAIEEANFISPNMSENFNWMPREHMCVLVYVISVLHSMQAGFLDKAQKYAEKALMQIERLRTQLPQPDQLLDTFHILLLEHMSMCHLVMGNRVVAIKQIVQTIQMCYRASPKMRLRHRGIIRTLLGFYAMSMSMIEDAENHFNRVMNDNDVGTELRVMAMLNLALCYLQDETRRLDRRHDVEVLLSRLNPEQLNSLSYCLKAAAYYVYGLKAFCDERFNDAKRNLRETLKMANGEDLNRVTSCSLVLLGKIFNNSELPRESLNMVQPAIKLATKIPDLHVQLWASSVLKEIYARDIYSQHHIDATEMHDGFINRLNEDKLKSSTMPEHSYVRWADW
uniref:Cohesin loading complex subunit SCC4 homolog n=1 Tax=Aceria tosichella TaxID=561515 RepID=A0A6G1SNG0_9ACAR